jgi:hypothetical protein
MAESIRSKISGVTQVNENGISRQALIQEHLSEGDSLTLEREPNNPVDPNAIAIHFDRYAVDGDPKIGYIRSDLAVKIAPLMDAGQFIDCEVLNITGGEEGKETLGVNIELTVFTLDETQGLLKRAESHVTQKSIKKKKKFVWFPVIIGSMILCIGLTGFTNVFKQSGFVDIVLWVVITGAFILAGAAMISIPIYRYFKA